MIYRALAVTTIGLLTACTSRATAAPASSSVAATARCQFINDSLATISDIATLPQGIFRDGRDYRAPKLPTNIPKGTNVLIRFVTGSDGAAEPGTVQITGTDDASFRQQAIANLRGVRLLPARIDGCAVRSRVDVFITKI